MSSAVIKIENLWKEYRLGVIGHGTLTHDLQSWWAKMRGKEDPNAKITPILAGQEKQIEGDRFWALRDINLEVKEGEILGIIGKNGAGKSTLLKILSRVTAPTKGSIKVKGRIASLLEVGTGFHPELTGRENIFMNGAILGMSKQEIKSKLDEIIDFSGVEDFIDTPVKRYSSGMYVRLAFAVAAHLEPEILIIDEVLAVGDAEFQKKCLGKMKDVSKEGRTVLFVSHNMHTVTDLCEKSILLKNGNIIEKSQTFSIVNKYLLDRDIAPIRSPNSIGGVSIKSLLINAKKCESNIYIDELSELEISVNFESKSDLLNISIAVCFDDLTGHRILTLWTKEKSTVIDAFSGENTVIFILDKHRLLPGYYTITTYIDRNGVEIERIDKYCKMIVKQRYTTGIPMNTIRKNNRFKEEYRVINVIS
ncbi:MAG: ATP-binding cassette domain-containing protein [Candidatus Electrothrix sp. AW5]|nr:ATP-binding cassette domain-containing protein [Candidatus Electrothrix gigas]